MMRKVSLLFLLGSCLTLSAQKSDKLKPVPLYDQSEVSDIQPFRQNLPRYLAADSVFNDSVILDTDVDTAYLMQLLKKSPHNSNADIFGIKAIEMNWELMMDNVALPNRSSYEWFYSGGYDFFKRTNKSRYKRVIWTWDYLYEIINESNKLIHLLENQ